MEFIIPYELMSYCPCNAFLLCTLLCSGAFPQYAVSSEGGNDTQLVSEDKGQLYNGISVTGPASRILRLLGGLRADGFQPADFVRPSA